MKPLLDDLMKLVLALIALLLVSTSRIYSQDKPELFVSVEAALKKKEPTWTIEAIHPPTSLDTAEEGIVLRSEQGQALVQLTIWKDITDAINTFDAQSTVFDRTMGKRMVKTDLPNFAEANHLWTNAGSDAWPTLKFRQGGILVTVFGPSLKTVKGFAQEVDALIQASHH
jgi:hypothetical protein